jgi:hypothetical protein
MGWIPVLLFFVVVAPGCDFNSNNKVLRVDAEFDPATPQDTTQPIREANPGVAQTFTVLADGKFEEFWIVITQGESVDDGTIRITVRPLNAMGEPDADPGTSIIDPIDVDTSTLPAVLVDEFTEFFVGNDPDRQVLAGEEYAIVVDFVSRATSTDTNAIARMLGQAGDPYVDGTGSTGESGVGFTNNTEDYFFRTFVLR